jgi:hypothetical protein
VGSSGGLAEDDVLLDVEAGSNLSWIGHQATIPIVKSN